MSSEEVIRQQVAACLSLSSKSENRIDVSCPLYYGDGDGVHFAFERDEQGAWRITDDGDVTGRAWMNGNDLLKKGKLRERFQTTIRFHGITETTGALTMTIDETKPNAFGEAVFLFAQACIEILNIEKG